MDAWRILNVKLSVVLEPCTLETIKRGCLEREIPFDDHGNFVQFKHGTLSFGAFKSSLGKVFVNVTGLSSARDCVGIGAALRGLTQPTPVRVGHRIDSITASLTLKLTSTDRFLCNARARGWRGGRASEKCPALCLKFFYAPPRRHYTAIVYGSGKTLLFGCRHKGYGGAETVSPPAYGTGSDLSVHNG